jgi:hypothetical protein
MPVSEVGMEQRTDLLPIGRRERVSFPEWGLRRVRAKIDTGAYSSALGVSAYELVESESGQFVRLHVVPHRRPDKAVVVQAPVSRVVSIRTSSGRRELRPLIDALVRLGPIVRRIRLTVTDRSRMRCPMLLGRQALAGLFVVDVRQKDLLREPPTA